MLFNAYRRGATSIILRVRLMRSDLADGSGITGLNYSSSNLIISTICDNESSPTSYYQTGGNIQPVGSWPWDIGTYDPPDPGKCRFAEINSTQHPGIYEIHLDDARFAVTNAKSMIVSVHGATNLAEANFLVPLTDLDPYDATRGGMSALPNAAADNAGGLLISDAGGVDVDAMAATLEKLETTVQLADSGDYQFTEEALELGPTCTTYTLSTPGMSTPECYAPDEYLDLIYGKSNVDKWADLDNEDDATTITNRRAWAICTASALIDSRLRDGPYTIPFEEPIEPDIVDLCARWAGVLLYDGRLIREQDPITDEVGQQRKIIDMRIRQLLSGQIKLNLDRTQSAPRAF